LQQRSGYDGSRPARARGLKPVLFFEPVNYPFVAPRAGAWIETIWQVKVHKGSHVSRPARARGLKHDCKH